MDATESYPSTTVGSEVLTYSESVESDSTTTILSQISETITEATADMFTTTMTSLSDSNSNQSDLRFTAVDYSVFGVMLAMSGEDNSRPSKPKVLDTKRLFSALIGVYFGFFSKKKQNNTTEYILGGKEMNFFPIAASLIASHISGITLMSIPAEMYAYGTQYAVMIVSAVTVGVALTFIYLPVFYELQLTSSFEYLEMRFDKSVRLTASFIYTISMIIFIPIVVYVPALAFSQVSGMNLHVITFATSLVCVFYTTVGGLKAVVWTDTLQFILMLGAITCVIVLGLNTTGGLANVFETADRGGRLIFFK